MANHNVTGNEGEKIAVNFLRELGYKILHTNWRYRHREIDVICKDQDEVVFVEVKTRSKFEHANPNELITNSKIKHLINAAEEYIISNQIENESRFDVVIVVMDTPPQINHIPGAFEPTV
ncbi:MAG: hypothetical protein CL840_09995 [Crocinitomicaceae bacterium]|nr:hypothetical protein [Crocinitomicaceae bacterium]|tara:strand:- start:20305 stop:20664 length:360 start_codon:yes stop_codon:yes gene_type:complete